MMQEGFIREKRELKLLILYIAARLSYPVSFETMQEMVMSDAAVDFFEFSECMNYLTDSGHLSCSSRDLYTITEKGLENGRACEDEIPYSVRLRTAELARECNDRIRHSIQVQTSIAPRPNGTRSVTLRLNTEQGTAIWRTDLLVPDESQARDLMRRFDANPQKLYSRVIKALFGDEPLKESS